MTKRYTVYNQNKKSYELFGWQGATRKQSNEKLEQIIKKHELYDWAVYKVKDNFTNETVATNA